MSSHSSCQLVLRDCTHQIVARTMNGTYAVAGENHGKPFYQKIYNAVDICEAFIYYWDARDGPEFQGWWSGPAVGGKRVWAHNAGAGVGDGPPAIGWKVPYNGPIDENLVVEAKSSKTPAETQRSSSPYVEWRRMLKHDPDTKRPADGHTFVKVIGRLGLNTSEAEFLEDRVVVKLHRTKYGGLLNFFYNDGRIIIGQTNVAKKTALWHILAPATLEFDGRPTKTRKKGLSSSSSSWSSSYGATWVGNGPY